MTEIGFENITFEKNEECVKLTLLDYFEHEIPAGEIEAIGSFDVKDGNIFFDDVAEKTAENKMFRIMDKALRHLYSKETKKQAFYVHADSGIPLIGSLAFGIVDRGTDMLEVKPITGCNINCVFCSVDEGISSKKTTDVVVECDFLVDEVRKLLKFKGHDGVDIYINPHGDPTLYADLINLVKGLSEIPQVRIITMITNALLLTEEKIDQLISAGLNRINISISATDDAEAKKMAGYGKYDVNQVMKIIEYCSTRISTFICPVYMPGVNDEQIENVVAWAKDVEVTIGIQNFLQYKGGRNPVKGIEMSEFYTFLEGLEKKYSVNLHDFDYELVKTKELPCPFKKNDVVKAEIKLAGRYPHEKIVVAEGRCITVRGCDQESGFLKIKVIKVKNNIVSAVVV